MNFRFCSRALTASFAIRLRSAAESFAFRVATAFLAIADRCAWVSELARASRDGSWVAFMANWGRWGPREMWAMRPNGGDAHKLYDTDQGSFFAGAEWSPDGQ